MDNQTTKRPTIDSRTKIIVAVLAVVILVFVIFLLLPKNNGVKTPIANNNQTGGQTAVDNGTSTVPTDTGKTTVVKDQFRADVPANTVVPDKNTVLTDAQKKEIAIPTVVTPAAPGVESQFRSFDIKAEGGVFTPSKIIANVGDTIHVNFTAVDKDYDIVFPSYNMKQTAKKGQTKILEFQAVTDGSFTYYCEICGGPASTAKGNIIIVK